MGEAVPVIQNHRRALRLTPKAGTKVRCFKNILGLGQNLAQSIFDLHQEGAGIILKEELPIGHRVELNLESSNIRNPIKVIGTIVWIKPAADKTFRAGVHFDRTISYPELTMLARV